MAETIFPRRGLRLAVAAIVTVAALTGCGNRRVDPLTAGAEPVPGTGALYRFCDQSTLIYVSVVDYEPDNFEAFFYGGCTAGPDGAFRPAIAAGDPPLGEDTNQQDERDEGQ